MALLDLPDEIQLEIARHIGEEQRNNHYGVFLTCKKLNNIHCSFLYKEPFITNKKGRPGSLHRFIWTIENKPVLKQLVKALDVDLNLIAPPPLLTPDWGETIADTVRQLGQGFDSDLWYHKLLRGDIAISLGLVMLRLPALERFTMSSYEILTPSSLTTSEKHIFFGLNEDVVRNMLPSVRRICSRKMIDPVPFWFRASDVQFVVAFNTFPFFYPQSHSPFLEPLLDSAYDTITSMCIEFDIQFLAQRTEDMNPEPHYTMVTLMTRLLGHLSRLRTFKANLIDTSHNTPTFNPDFEADMHILTSLFPSDASLESLDISVHCLSRRTVKRFQPLRWLSKFNSLRHLRAPQTGLSWINPGEPLVCHLFDVLRRVETLTVTEASSDCHLFATGLSQHPWEISMLQHVHVQYQTKRCFEEDKADIWNDLAERGITVMRSVPTL